MYVPADDRSGGHHAKRLAGAAVSGRKADLPDPADGFVGREYMTRDWAMQLHYGALRNVNGRMVASPRAGYRL